MNNEVIDEVKEIIDVDQESIYMEIEAWVIEVAKKSVLYSSYNFVHNRYFDLMKDIGILEKYQSKGQLDSYLSLDVKQNLYDHLGNFCANFVADLNNGKLRQSMRMSGLSEGEILHRNARVYSQALQDGDFNRVYMDLNSEMKRVLYICEKSAEGVFSCLYNMGTYYGVTSNISMFPGVTQLFINILDDILI